MGFWTIWFAIGIITVILVIASDLLTGHGKEVPVWTAIMLVFMSVFGPFFSIYVIFVTVYIIKNKKRGSQ